MKGKTTPGLQKLRDAPTDAPRQSGSRSTRRTATRSPLESSVKKAVLRYLTEHFPGGQIRKRHGSAFETAGDPDVYALIDGRHLEIELKRPGEEPTALQRCRLAQWKAAGALTACVHSVDELVHFLAECGLGVVR